MKVIPETLRAHYVFIFIFAQHQEQELLTLLEQLSSPLVFSGSCYSNFSVY